MQTLNKTYQLVFPADLPLSLKMQEDEFSSEIRKLVLIKLFELGKISSGKAAVILGISRLDFLEILQQYQVNFFNDASPSNILKDINNA